MRVMSRTRLGAIVVFGMRIAYGAALLAAPDKVTKRWLGPGRSAAPATVALRGLGAREVAIHTAGLLAALPDAPPRPAAAGRRGRPGPPPPSPGAPRHSAQPCSRRPPSDTRRLRRGFAARR